MARPLWRNDWVMLALGTFSVALVYWFEVAALNDMQRATILAVDSVLVLVFLADWLLQWREAAWARRWFVWNSWRLLGMVPLFIAAFAFLRLLRLVRVIAVLDHIPPVRRGLHTLRRNLDFPTLAPLAIAAGSITIGGALLVWLAERGSNPDLAAFSEAVWWAVVTVTTVGYGDITPITRIGRLVAVGLMVTGIGTIGMLASQVSSAIIERREEEIEDEVMAEAAPDSVVWQLKAVAELHEAGKLSDDEFDTAKSRILE